MRISKESALLCHKLLAHTRALNAILELRRSRIEGPVLTGLGAEGISVGVGMALWESGILDTSVLLGDQRTQYGFGVTKNEAFPDGHDHAYEILKNYALAATSTSQGEDGNIHWGCLEHGILPFASSDMGRMVPVLTGMIEEIRRVQWPAIVDPAKRPVGVGTFGEGALNQGCIAETFDWVAASNCKLNNEELECYQKFMDEVGKNLRVLRGAPAIYIINRNQFSIYTGAREEHGRSTLALRALGYGDMRGVSAKGWDVFDVIEKMREAVREAQGLRATLLDAETFRLTGHNADQIERDPELLKRGILNQGKILGLDPGEFQRAWEFYDPLKNCRESLLAWGFATRGELEEIERHETQEIETLFDQAFREPESTFEEREKKSLYIAHAWTLPVVRENASSDKKMRYNEALVWELANELRSDPRVTVFGEDIHLGGVLGETRGRGGYLLAEEFGEARVHSTPIAEEAITSVAAGRALAGGKPKFFYQFAPFWGDSFPAWRSVIAPNWWQKKMKFDFVGITPFGVVHDGGSGEYHESCIEGYFALMDGIVLLFPADAYDVVGMLRAAHEYPGPVMVFLQTYAFGKSEFSATVPAEPYLVPFGQAHVRREGNDVSVFAYGAAAVRAAENEAEFLSRDGISVEVIDIRCLWPLDTATLMRSAEKTGRVIIMHEAKEKEGCGMMIKHELDKTGVTRFVKTGQAAYILAAENNPSPTKKSFLWARLPFEKYVVRKEDTFGEGTILRSGKLARLAKNLVATWR